jgi:predicted MPP superfamily phosphohydrolase
MLHHVTGWLRTQGKARPVRRRWAHWIGRSWARVSYGYRVEPTWLELNRLEIPVNGLAAEFAGFRIAQLTDFHCSRKVTAPYLTEAVALAGAQQADLIVLTGDFIHHGFKYIDAMADQLGRLSAPFGVHAVLGNHDFSVRNALGIRRFRNLHEAVAQALTARGIRVLRNETICLQRANADLYLTGVDDLWSRGCDVEQAFRGLNSTVPRVVLAHNPQTIERLGNQRCDLMFSGHTHGGQINWPGIGRPTLSKRARRFAAGLYRYRNSYLYVNKGIGFGFRFRFGVRPEVAVATLRPA